MNTFPSVTVKKEKKNIQHAPLQDNSISYLKKITNWCRKKKRREKRKDRTKRTKSLLTVCTRESPGPGCREPQEQVTGGAGTGSCPLHK